MFFGEVRALFGPRLRRWQLMLLHH